MKLVKMSLAAAVLLGASAFAIDNVKVNGDAKVYYSTNDADYVDGDGNTQSGLFDQGASAADTALRLGVTGDLLKGVSFGATGYAVSTLGLENNLVSNTWTGAHGDLNNLDAKGVQDQAWMGELWLAATMGKTTAKVGRMELDTPLAYSEKWSIVPNTFEAAVLINQDIPDTTLVGAFVGKGNGHNVGQGDVGGLGLITHGYVNSTNGLGIDGIMGVDANFDTFVDGGAYAVAIVNNSFKPATVQAWYYNVLNTADAYWLQADIDCSLVKGVKIGAQYSEMDTKGALSGIEDSSAYAFKLGYEGIENLKLSVAYSEADEKGVLKIANVATNNLESAESKLYTETFWNRGWVGAAGAESWNAKASYDMKNVAKFCVSYTDVSIGATNATNVAVGGLENEDMTEVAVAASKSFGPLDAKLAYISTDITDEKRSNTINAYLTLNF